MHRFFDHRKLFKIAVEKRGGIFKEHFLGPVVTYEGQPLSVASAHFASPNPKSLLIHISGTHGVEGPVGSDIQLAILNNSIFNEEIAVVFIHILNPWGMCHLRRVNENNVDLNRNFFLSGQWPQGAPNAYRQLFDFINPTGPFLSTPSFYLSALKVIAKYGYRAVKEAIVAGQYEFPDSLYYGGSHLEASNVCLITIIVDELTSLGKDRVNVFGIEVHSGLGKWGKEVIFAQEVPFSAFIKEKYIVETAGTKDGIGYACTGEIGCGIAQVLTSHNVWWGIQEFGTYPGLKVFRALRDEAHYVREGGSSLNHWTKEALTEVFYPHSAQWGLHTINKGRLFFDDVVKNIKKFL